MESVEGNSTSLEFHEPDNWSLDVEYFARKLCQQYFGGRLYPIDYIELERLLEERAEDDRPTRVSRATRRVINAKKLGEGENQTFELLKTVLEEEQNVREKNMISSNKAKPKLSLDNESLRLQTLEEATKRILDSESRHGNVGGKEIEELRAVYFSKPSVDEKILNKSK